MAPTQPYDDAAASAALADDGGSVAEPPFEASPPQTVASESVGGPSVEEAEPQVEVVVKDAYAADAPFTLGYAGPGGEIVETEVGTTAITVPQSVGERLKESTVVKYVGEEG